MADFIKRARRGERAALESLLAGHLALVYRFVASRVGPGDPELEDIVQETLIGAAGSIGQLRGDDEPALVRWLLSIAQHKVADNLRRRADRRDDPFDEAPGIVALSGDSTEVLALAVGRRREVREALRGLTSEQEEVLIMKFAMGYTNVEIAAITGRTEGAIKSLQHRGLASLGRRLKTTEEEWTGRTS